jgi:hypothetical protein
MFTYDIGYENRNRSPPRPIIRAPNLERVHCYFRINGIEAADLRLAQPSTPYGPSICRVRLPETHGIT